MQELINDSVGNNMANEEGDVFAVKDGLSSLERFDEENGMLLRLTVDKK